MTKKLEELDLLKISRMDYDVERLMMGMQLGRNHMENLQKQLKKRTEERKVLFDQLKEKYEIESDFDYNHETGEISIPDFKPTMD